MDNKDNIRGFSGLSNLTSGVNNCVKPTIYELTPKMVIPEAKQPQEPTKSISSNKGYVGYAFALILCVGIFYLLFALKPGQTPQRSSYSVPSSPQHNSPPPVQTPSVPQSTGLQYTKPPVGTNNILSVAEIRWCIAMGIAIDAVRDVINSDSMLNKFNILVNDYNSRCGSYKYRKNDQSSAERDVAPYRSQIASEAILEAKQFDRSSQPQIGIKGVQQMLKDLAYDPGPIDGQYGVQTANAIRAFQRDRGLTQDGKITQGLLNELQKVRWP